MQLSTLSIRRPVLATVLNLVILLIGVISYQRLAVRLIPNVDVPIVTVRTITRALMHRSSNRKLQNRLKILSRELKVSITSVLSVVRK